MNRTRYVLGVAFALGSCFMACNYTDGECFPREELYETAGVGGGPIVPTGVGVGGYGQGPFEPQNVDPDQEPVCNIISGGPCDDGCQAQYDVDSIACADIKDDAQRRACQDTAHQKYKDCEDKCDQQASRSCREKYDDCVDGTTGREWCRRKAPGTSTSYCERCWERCTSGDPPSVKCWQCGF